MMTICNVSLLNLLEFLLEESIFRGIQFPESVNHRYICLILILLYDAIGLLRLCQVGDFLLNGCVLTRAVSQENWSYIGALDVCQQSSIFLLLLQSLFMLLD